MSERDENEDGDEKITVLFPDDDQGAEEAEEIAEQAVVGDEGDDNAPGEKEADEAADVVRLDFGDDDRRSLREVVAEAEESGDDVEQTKYEIFQRMIEDGMVMVTLDTRFSTVSVPPKFEGLPELRLNFSHLFQIDDFEYDDRGVRASLSFEGKRHFCDIPWEAVFMLYSHETGDVVVFDPGEPS